ncbi:hypothetical protein [Streptomyces sp. NPDC049040]|uniref:hypothetical protein n=1 Tax=Streptomyces sp. NPDC049040 TaxID=3365593 RepID=UPI00371199C4
MDLPGLLCGDEVLLGLLLAARSCHGITLAGPITGSFARRLTAPAPANSSPPGAPSLPLALAVLPI